MEPRLKENEPSGEFCFADRKPEPLKGVRLRDLLEASISVVTPP